MYKNVETLRHVCVKHSQKSHREGNRERISSGGRCTKERGGRKAELPLFPSYFEFEIEPKRGGTRGEARNLIEVRFHYEGQGGGGRKERLFVL